MARKKQEIALQTEVETQERWEELLQKEGLIVVDVYQEWCGPCRAMTSFFRRIKNETGDDLLHFAIAKADNIDSLERYRGKSEPCFLFYGGGSLVAVVRGANPPVIDRTIRQKLDQEHKIIRGDSEREEIRDPAFAHLDDMEKGATDEKEAEETEVDREVTFALIKPDAVAEGKVEEILAKLAEAGIEVLYTEERQMTEEEARSFYSHLESEEFFEQYIEFMCSGNSVLLALAKGDEGVCNEFRELMGPKSVEEAKESAPESLRAQFGSENFKNAIHGADSRDSAARELAFFFPSFSVPKVAKKKEQAASEEVSVQRTLALIRPDAYNEFKDSIIAKIREAGFKIAMQKEVQLTKEQAEEFYKEHTGEEYFDELTTRMSSGPLIALALARQDAISGWRQMLGPTDVKTAKENAPESLRAQFSKEDIPINLLHGSSSDEEAEKELHYFFPMEQTVVAVKPDAYENRDEIMDKIKESGFHIAARKETQLTPEMAREFYKDLEDKDYYDDLVEHMTSGNTLFMVLSREDAVHGWRSVMGTTDPEKAAEEAPDSLRAVYGKDIKQNALHGSSDTEHAQKSMQLIFGDVEFDAAEAEEGGDGGETHRSEAEAAEEPAGTGEAAEPAPEGEEKPAEEGEEAAPEAASEAAPDAAPAAEGEEAAEAEAGEGEGEAPAAEEAAPEDGETTAETGEAATAEGEGEAAAAESGEGEAAAAAPEAEDAPEGEAAGGESAPEETPAPAADAPAAEEAPAAAAEEETPAAPATEEKAESPPAEDQAEIVVEQESTEVAPPASETKEPEAEETKEAEAEETKEVETDETKEVETEETKEVETEETKEVETQETKEETSEPAAEASQPVPETKTDEQPAAAGETADASSKSNDDKEEKKEEEGTPKPEEEKKDD